MTLIRNPVIGIDIKPILSVLGLLIMILGMCMVIPLVYDYIHQIPDVMIFTKSATLTFVLGSLLFIPNIQFNTAITLKQGYIITVIAWVCLPILGALPLWLSSTSPVDFSAAYFEAMSGITTTGASVYISMEKLTQGVLLWRSILQWLGGVGIVVMALSVFPLIGIGGMQVFKIEFTNELEKAKPRLSQIGFYISISYIFITILCIFAYYLAGMNGFDAFNHALTTISTGGYSTHSASIAYFHSVPINIVATVFMLISAMPLIVFYHMFFSFTFSNFFKDEQIRGLLGIFLFIASIVIAYLIFVQHWDVQNALVSGSFNIASALSGTGFVTADYSTWGQFVIPVFLFTMLIGGAAGSASCGIKIFRIQILSRIFFGYLRRLSEPNLVVPIYYAKKNVSSDVETSVFVVFLSYIFVMVLVTLLLSFTGNDLLTAVSASIATLGNVGPGLGSVVGPKGYYGHFSDFELWILSINMLLGRLEILAVLVIFSRKFWENIS